MHARRFLTILLLLVSSVAAGQTGQTRLVRLQMHRSFVHRDTIARLDPSGIELEDVTLQAWYDKGRWLGPKFTTPDRHLAGLLFVPQIDLSGLDWQDARISGQARAIIGRINTRRDAGEGENMHSMLKARRRPVVDWQIGGPARVIPSAWTCRIDAQIEPDHMLLELTLNDLVGDNDRKSLHARIPFSEGQSEDGSAMARSWNKGQHTVDGGQLRLQEGKLTGRMTIHLTPDPWVPRSRDGSRLRTVQCTVDATVRDGRVEGTYQAEGDFGRYEAKIAGTAWQVGSGSWQIQDVDGQRSGRLTVLAKPDSRPDEPAGSNDPAQLPEPMAGPAEAKDNDIHGYGSGLSRHYPDAQPPVYWDISAASNIAWSVDLPSAQSAPIVHRGRIFVTAEPNELICLEARTGRRLWSQKIEPVDAEGPDGQEATLARFRAALARAEAMDNQADQIGRQIRRLRRDKSAAQQVEQLQAQQKQLREDRQQLLDSWAAYRKALETVGLNVEDELGRRAGTVPVARGDRVFVLLGTSVAACFDLDGKLQWKQATGRPFSGGTEFSPLLVGERLICPGSVPAPELGHRNDRAATLTALDAATGKLLWQSAKLGPDGQAATAALVAGGEKPRPILLLPDATVIDPADGSVLARNLFKMSSPVRPCVSGNDAIFVARNTGQARLGFAFDAGGKLTVRTIWQIGRAGWSSPQITAPGLIYDGRFYLPRSSDENAGHHPVAWDQLDVYETRWGQHLARPNPVITSSATPLPLVRAGGWLIFSDAGRRAYNEPPQAAVALMTTGPAPRLLYRKEMDSGPLLAEPVCFGPHMLLRTPGRLICAGTGSAESLKQDLRAMVNEAIGRIGRRPQLDMARIDPPADYKPQRGVPVWQLSPNVPPDRWLMAGPFVHGRRQAPDAEKDLGSLRPAPGQQIQLAGTTASFAPLPAEARILRGVTTLFLSGQTLYQPSYAIDLNAAIDQADTSSTLFYTVVRVDEPTAVRLRSETGQAWLSGQKLPDAAAVHLSPGLHPLLLRVDIFQFPPVGRVRLWPHFNPILAPEAGRRNWLGRIEAYRPLLRRALAELDDSRETRWAQLLLDELKNDDKTAPSPDSPSF